MGTATAFQAGLDRAEARRQDREAHDMLQRQFLAQQYQHLADNIRLPDAKADPEGYKDALDQRAKLLDAMQKVYSPEHHATLAEHLHGLIFGPKRQPVASPVSGQAPVAPGSPAPATAADPGAAQPAPEHPFAHNPVYAEILKGLDGLGSRLKAASSPAPQQPLPSIASFASVPTDAELAAKDAATKAAQAEELQRLKNKGTLDAANARGKFTAMSTPQKAFLNRWAVDHGADDFQSLSSDQQTKALQAFKAASAPASHLQLKAENGNLYVFDPATGKMTFKAKLNDVRKTQGVRFVTNALTGEVSEVPYTTYTSKESGAPIADDNGAPMGAAPDDQKPPASSQAPSLDAANRKIAAGNATSKKLNKGKPTSKSAPKVVAHTASLMDKSVASQYTKAAEDARSKKIAYQNAAGLLADSHRQTDLELVYAWVRANVQGAGRMTNTEIQQTATAGSWGTRIQNAMSQASTGRLSAPMEQQFISDIKRSWDNAQKEADDLKAQLQGTSAAPASQPNVIVVTAEDMKK